MNMYDNSNGDGCCSDSDEAITNREALILGKPPRISANYSETVVKAAQAHVAKLRGTSPESADAVAVAEIPEMVVALLGCHPELYEKVADVSVQLMARTSLPRRDLELVVLRTDWLCQSPYNWGEHVRIAKRFGVTTQEIERITLGSIATGWSEHDRALVRAAEELHENAAISDATWNTLSAVFDEKQMFELIVLVGQFSLVTYFQNTLRLRLSPGNEGLKAR